MSIGLHSSCLQYPHVTIWCCSHRLPIIWTTCNICCSKKMWGAWSYVIGTSLFTKWKTTLRNFDFINYLLTDQLNNKENWEQTCTNTQTNDTHTQLIYYILQKKYKHTLLFSCLNLHILLFWQLVYNITFCTTENDARCALIILSCNLIAIHYHQ